MEQGKKNIEGARCPEAPAKDYAALMEEKAGLVYAAMEKTTSAADMERLRKAYELARTAHAKQKRKTGEPYIFHPIAVATIAATELNLDVNSVIAAFLHDVVEDTPITNEDIQRQFGDDVAFLVRVVTKQKKEHYEMSKQLDNFKQMLNSVQYDIRALLVKLADRLHNMRTLASMRADKQMKIAGETDYFYAPLATRLGLYNVKAELENLSLRFRCPHEYMELSEKIENDKSRNRIRLEMFTDEIRDMLAANGIKARVYSEYRRPYSLWRKMHKSGDDFDHLKYRHFVEIVFENPEGISEKGQTLKIYSILTDRFKEKPGGIVNYIDSPKENGYQSFHLKLLADFGNWQEIHISSERMVRNSQFGCLSDRSEGNIKKWISKFRDTLKEISKAPTGEENFIENVVASFYNDDIMVFSPQGKPVVLPQHSSVIDFAYEIHSKLGEHAKYARVNGRLAPINKLLNRGDIVEIYPDVNSCHPEKSWLDFAVSYKARKAISSYLAKQSKSNYDRCPVCKPIPGEEVIGFKENNGRITVHKRDCKEIIRLVTQRGDNIVSVDFQENQKVLYPVNIEIKCVDRHHMIIDLVDCITNELNLSIGSINTETVDAIVTIRMTFGIHSYHELQSILSHIRAIPDVDEVKILNIS